MMMTGGLFFILMAQAAAPAQPATTARPAAPATAQAPQQVTKAQLQAQVKASFDRADLNKDGWIDQPEGQTAFETARAAQMKTWSDLVGRRFVSVDTNKDGQLSRQEFEASLDKPKFPATSPWITANDTDKNGKVSLEEATTLAMKSFDAADADRNGTVTQQEARANQARQGAGQARAATGGR